MQNTGAFALFIIINVKINFWRIMIYDKKIKKFKQAGDMIFTK